MARVRGGKAAVDRAIIAHVCVRQQHRDDPAPSGMGTLTIYGGQWAYCHASALAEEHEWQPTGGVGIEQLVAATRRVVEHRPAAPAAGKPEPETAS